MENLQTSTSKLQRNTKRSSSNEAAAGSPSLGFGVWDLGFLWSLDVDAWRFRKTATKARRAITHAFTLIELMVVLVLIGIMTAVLIPEMRGSYEDALLRSSSREIINVCHLTYSRAVSLNQVHRLQLDEHTGKYFVEKRVRETDQGGDFVRVQDVSGLEGELDKRITIQIRDPGEEPSPSSSPSPSPDGSAPLPAEPGPQLSDSNAGILFNPDGTADAREIRLRDRDGFRLGLRINPVTARIHIVELPRE